MSRKKRKNRIATKIESTIKKGNVQKPFSWNKWIPRVLEPHWEKRYEQLKASRT